MMCESDGGEVRFSTNSTLVVMSKIRRSGESILQPLGVDGTASNRSSGSTIRVAVERVGSCAYVYRHAFWLAGVNDLARRCHKRRFCKKAGSIVRTRQKIVCNRRMNIRPGVKFAAKGRMGVKNPRCLSALDAVEHCEPAACVCVCVRDQSARALAQGEMKAATWGAQKQSNCIKWLRSLCVGKAFQFLCDRKCIGLVRMSTSLRAKQTTCWESLL